MGKICAGNSPDAEVRPNQSGELHRTSIEKLDVGERKQQRCLLLPVVESLKVLCGNNRLKRLCQSFQLQIVFLPLGMGSSAFYPCSIGMTFTVNVVFYQWDSIRRIPPTYILSFLGSLLSLFFSK